MSRTTTILTIGACVLVLGAALVLQADALATTWHPLPDGNGRGGLTDPGLRQSYTAVGLVGLCLGAGLMGMAAWHWLAAERRDHYSMPGQPV
jgi:hypothetical protein